MNKESSIGSVGLVGYIFNFDIQIPTICSSSLQSSLLAAYTDRFLLMASSEESTIFELGAAFLVAR